MIVTPHPPSFDEPFLRVAPEGRTGIQRISTRFRNDYSRLIGQGRAVDARFAVQIKVTITATGEVVVDRLVVRDTCG